ncbi:DUF6153 family protein [Microbacterium esteraromaticum]|uniref:DUF6153 family protein n=1 Tax=Microbacterium esteraromaticum TaxID=57043 RepID=UPI003D6A7DDA
MLGTAAALIIVGLLAMHTFTGKPAGHGSPGISHAASTAADGRSQNAMASVDRDAAACIGSCHVSTGQGQGHDDMVTACVLALLAGLLLLVPPTLARRHGVSLRELTSWLPWEATDALPRGPSLTVLSISRT